MLGFGKKNKESKNKKRRGDVLDVDPSINERIHVMPERFYVAPKKNRSGLWILIVAGVVIIGGLAAAAFYLNEDLKRNDTNGNQPAVNQPPVNAAPANQPPVNTTPVATTTIPVAEPATTTPQTSTSTDAAVSPPPELPAPLPSAVDADSDQLTEIEEQLFGTNPAVADTDGDTFTDGAELLNGYDPTRPKQLLSASSLVLSYTHPRYALLYPRSWLVRPQDDEKNNLRFIAETGELVEVLVIANPRRQVLPDWYREQFPQANVAGLTSVKIGTLSGLRSVDELNYYFADPSQNDVVYVISYNVGAHTTTNFATTFTMMVKSFKLLQ